MYNSSNVVLDVLLKYCCCYYYYFCYYYSLFYYIPYYFIKTKPKQITISWLGLLLSLALQAIQWGDDSNDCLTKD